MTTEDNLIITDVERIAAMVESWSMDFESLDDAVIKDLHLKFEMRDFKRTLRQLDELKHRLITRLG